MPKSLNTAEKTAPIAPFLATALEENKDVKVRVESAANDLAAAGTVLKAKIAGGDPEWAAHVALEVSKAVEHKVAECAADLHAVNCTLEQGLADLEHTESALAVARAALANTRVALVAAREGEREAQFAACHDSATGMPNREHFDSRLTHDIAVAARQGFELAVMFFDLNKFKEINDTLGHAAGDEVLKQIAARLLKHCRAEDTVCRTGGDEFLYLLINPKGRENIQRIASTLVAALAMPVHFDDREIVVRPSIGISIYPGQGASASELISHADAAMYHAKKTHGGPGWAFYDVVSSLS